MTNRSKQVHQSHNHGLKGQTNFDRIVDGSPHKIRGITQICMFRGGRVQGLISAAHFESLPLWFRLPSRWRREAVHLLTKPRNTQARRPEGKRVLALAGVRHQKKLTVDLTSRKDAIRCQRPEECMSGIGRPIAFPQVLPRTLKSPNQKRQIWKVIVGCRQSTLECIVVWTQRVP